MLNRFLLRRACHFFSGDSVRGSAAQRQEQQPQRAAAGEQQHARSARKQQQRAGRRAQWADRGRRQRCRVRKKEEED